MLLRQVLFGVFALMIVLGHGVATGAEASPTVLKGNVSTYDMRLAASLLIDDSGELSFDAVRSADGGRRFDGGGPLSGSRSAAKWLRFTVHNPDTQARTWWFDTGNRALHELDFFAEGSDGAWTHQQASSLRPFAQRPLPTADFVFPFDLAAGQTATLYLRVRSVNALAPHVRPAVWQPDAYRAHGMTERVQWFSYLGACLALAILNLMIWVHVKDAQYGWYVASLVGTFLLVSFTGGGYGAAYETLIPNSPVLYQLLRPIGLAAASTAPAYFAWRLLGAHQFAPRLTRAMVWSCVAIWSIVLVHGFAFLAQSSLLVTLMRSLVPVLALGVACVVVCLLVVVVGSVRAAIPFARFVAVAYLPLYLMALQSVLAFWLGRPLQPEYIMWASVFELLVMALALAWRFQLERSQKEAASIARDQATSRERMSILRDMHDGVGSHLSSAIRQLQSGHASQPEVLLTLHDALDQLKLSIDSMNLPPGDVASLLASIRYRLAPRFTAMDLDLKWSVAVLPCLPHLDARSMHQLQCIIFEAFSNVMQHSMAKILHVEAMPVAAADACGHGSAQVRIRISDNGCGFDTGSVMHKGLAAMHERARAIGVQLAIASRPGETMVELLIE